MEVSARRYRYTGKERDEETGLYYHGARYYAPWLARWTAADPARLAGGMSLFNYARNNPVRLSDPSGALPPSAHEIDEQPETPKITLQHQLTPVSPGDKTTSAAAPKTHSVFGGRNVKPPTPQEVRAALDHSEAAPEPEWQPPVPKEVSPEAGDWDVAPLPIGPAVSRQEGTVEEARKAIHEEAEVRANADLVVEVAKEFAETLTWYAGRTRGLAPPTRAAAAPAVAATRSAVTGEAAIVKATGAVLPGAEGGAGFGKLADRTIRLSEKLSLIHI